MTSSDASRSEDPTLDPKGQRQIPSHAIRLPDEARDAGGESRHEDVGQQIGRYKLLEQIGEGGFGTVWAAEQREPVKRRVALKIIKLGMDTKQVIARFEAERQALAMMDHPNIAKVLDAGSTDRGRPYFVMELVKGVPILDYCDSVKLDTKARLDLFIKVCNAIQHAHQKGIIHRDIKPSNVLVTLHDGMPVPKVIDFGVAKATNAELTEKTIYTQHRQMIGTPAYMSPEQAEMSGLDIDTRSDIYSLGVLLYELLTGTTPFANDELMSKGYAEMMRIIREVEPHKPSTRLSSLGESATRTALLRHAGDPKKLHALFRGDLDWIVMKCLEKDRSRRYDTANGLATDIQRHLNDEPVTAGPPNQSYRLRKFIKRNRVSVTAGAVIAVVLVVAVTSSTVLYVRAENARRETADERDRAVAAEQRAATVAEFLQDLIGYADPHATKRPDFTMREALDEAARNIGAQLSTEPEVEATVRTSIGRAYLNLDQPDLAEPHYREALALRRKLYGDTHERMAESIHNLALVYHDRAEYPESERLHRQALEMRRAVHGPRYPKVAESMTSLADLIRHRGDLDAAEAMAREAAEMALELVGEEDPVTLRAWQILAIVWSDQGRYAEAATLAERTMEIRKRLGPEDWSTLLSMNNLANVYSKQGRHDEAVTLQRQVQDINIRTLGPEHPTTLQYMAARALEVALAGRLDEAETQYDELLKTRQRVLGPDHPNTLQSMRDLGWVYGLQGRHADAEALRRRTFELRERVLGPEHPDTLTSMGDLCASLIALGRFDDAEPILRRNLDLRLRVSGPDHTDTRGAESMLIMVLVAQGRLAESRPLTAAYLERLKQAAKLEMATAKDLNRVAWLLVTVEPADLREPELALRYAQQSCAREDANDGPMLWAYLDTLALAQHLTGDTISAIESEKRAISLIPEETAEQTIKELNEHLKTFERSLSETGAVTPEADGR